MSGPLTRQGFRGLIRHQAVAVVGRAGSLIGQGLGAEIDAADVVVRVNHWEGIDPESTGQRTDICYHAKWDPDRDWVQPPGPECWFIERDPDLRRKLSSKKRKYRVTTGVICVYECIRFARLVSVYGFDFYQSAYANGTDPRPKIVNGRVLLEKRYHIPKEDRKLVRALLGNSRFRPDRILRRALGQ